MEKPYEMWQGSDMEKSFNWKPGLFEKAVTVSDILGSDTTVSSGFSLQRQ